MIWSFFEYCHWVDLAEDIVYHLVILTETLPQAPTRQRLEVNEGNIGVDHLDKNTLFKTIEVLVVMPTAAIGDMLH